MGMKRSQGMDRTGVDQDGLAKAQSLDAPQDFYRAINIVGIWSRSSQASALCRLFAGSAPAQRL
jgi:hypothetical protein